MSVRSAQSVTVEFTTQVFATGVATNADSLPVGTLVVNGTDNGASVTVTNVDAGRYKAAVTLPTLAVGDIVELSVAATVSTVAGKAIVWRDSKDFFAGSIPDVIAGGNGGLVIAGANAATTFATLTSTGAFSINGVSDVAQTGDSFARIGATGAGLISLASHADALSLASGIALVQADTDDLQSRLPAALVAGKMDSTGSFALDLTQAIGSSQTDGTVGAAFLGMEAQSVGKWEIAGNLLTLYRRDGVTLVRTFTLDSATAPTART